MLAHIGWPAVALAVVYLIGRAVKEKETWWRLVFGIVVLAVVAMGIVVACVRVLGVQVPGFHLPATSRTPVPTASAWPQHEVPATAAPEAVPIPTAASGSPCGHTTRHVTQATALPRVARAALPRAQSRR